MIQLNPKSGSTYPENTAFLNRRIRVGYLFKIFTLYWLNIFDYRAFSFQRELFRPQQNAVNKLVKG